MIWFIILMIIYLFQIVTIVLLEFKHPSKAVAWLLISFCFPLIGFVMYYFLAQDYTARRRVRKRETWAGSNEHVYQLTRMQVVQESAQLTNAEMRSQERLFTLISSVSESPVTGCNKTTVLTNGQVTYESMLAAIREAKDHIHMEFYIMRDDAIGAVFQDALIAKAKAGVRVRIIVDGVGSMELRRKYLHKFRQAGVEFHWFLPLVVSFFRRRLNFRNHRKIVIVDGTIGFIGGLNIGDDYLGLNEKLGFWRDTHLRIEGDAVYTLQGVFLHDWAFVTKEIIVRRELFPPHACQAQEQVKMISSGPDKSWDAIQELFFSAITAAKYRVWMMTPYFIPDISILFALKTAAVSGIDVRIIIPGKSDSRLVDWASLSYVEELLQAGVRFYQYQKGFAHAKTLVMDRSLASVGSANMDMRSFFSNFEATAVLFDTATIDRVTEDFERDFADSVEIRYREFVQRSRKQRMTEAVVRLLSPLL
ncbi:cardiolipin synthase [Paenibacillus sp. 481]|uniref:cardiolipin synthase n=1 Tax=Paenibacillus sp. 481 TaxID=2835869 RepID=UPI001E5CC9B0|nr:cardiolipin synthase [Paenibacillus sp. 481]UHA71977.1 cardiolipin synthase [Paenibacillus sp. 481]